MKNEFTRDRNVEEQQAENAYRRKRRRKKQYQCHVCNKELPFCWICRCGFEICADCMEDNLWGMTCNAITWTCPDCGQLRQFGNQ
jgi:hypothetical protein